jgi:hypothetical protein
MNPVSTHQLVLLYIINKTNGTILELGAGDCSTRQIHEIAKGRKILTIDHDSSWIKRYYDIKTKLHKFRLISNEKIKDFYLKDNEHWSVVLVDNIHWDIRVPAIMRYKDTSDYLVVHDAQFSVETGNWGNYVDGNRDFSDTFKYWIEFSAGEGPTTVLGSNKFDLENIEIEGMIILNRNK